MGRAAGPTTLRKMPALPERIGPYEITGKLGEGGMGIVYSANDTRLNRPVALKMILDSYNDEDSRKRFLREAQAAALRKSIPYPDGNTNCNSSQYREADASLSRISAPSSYHS